jgi:hypothetical protein
VPRLFRKGLWKVRQPFRLACEYPSLLGGASKSLKKLGKRKRSTSQKAVAGAALSAIGLSMFVKRRKAIPPTEAEADILTDATAAEQNLAAMDANA